MESGRLLLNAQDVRDDEGVGEWAVCAAADATMSPGEIAESAGFGHKKMMLSKAGILRSRGFEVVPDLEEGPVHVLIMLPVGASENPSEEQWEEVWDELRGCFEAPIRNPARR